jgi:hypothetical protein
VKKGINTIINGDLTGEEWIYFGDEQRSQVLYLVNHLEDDAIDSHWVMENNMTVFGFGRDINSVTNKQLTAVPGYFTVGFSGGADHQAIQGQIHSAYKPYGVDVGSGEHP